MLFLITNATKLKNMCVKLITNAAMARPFLLILTLLNLILINETVATIKLLEF